LTGSGNILLTDIVPTFHLPLFFSLLWSRPSALLTWIFLFTKNVSGGSSGVAATVFLPPRRISPPAFVQHGGVGRPPCRVPRGKPPPFPLGLTFIPFFLSTLCTSLTGFFRSLPPRRKSSVTVLFLWSTRCLSSPPPWSSTPLLFSFPCGGDGLSLFPIGPSPARRFIGKSLFF